MPKICRASSKTSQNIQNGDLFVNQILEYEFIEYFGSFWSVEGIPAAVYWD